MVVYLFLAALGIRVLYLSQYATTPFFWVPQMDALYHDLLARSIADGHPPQEAFFRAPLYYYGLAGVYRLFGHSFWAARAAQALVGSASCVLLYWLGCRVFRPVVALGAAAAMAFYGPLVYFDGELHTPVAEVFTGLLFLLLLVRAGERRRGMDWLLAGLALGVSAIARPNILVLTPVALWWAWQAHGGLGSPGSRRGSLIAAFLFLAAILAAPGLVTFRNWRVSGDTVFIASQGGINLYLGNRPRADGFTPSTPTRYRFRGEYEDSVALYGRRAAEEALGRPLRASEAQVYWIGRVLEWWRAEPLAALGLTAKKWVLAWSHREVRNNTAFDFIRSEFVPLLWLAPVGFWFAGTFGLAGMALAWRRGPAARLLCGFVLLYTASYVAFFVADRFRLPVVPVLLLFGVYAVFEAAEAFRRIRAGRLFPAARLAAAVAACGLLVGVEWFPTVTPATRALDFWSAGNRYRTLGHFPEAEAQYRKALALDPSNAECWLNLGAALYYSGRLPDAAESFRRALSLAPEQPAGYYNLAVLELQAGRPASARQLLVRAVQLDPGHAGARQELERLASAAVPAGGTGSTAGKEGAAPARRN